jgi:hypothetical protein
VHSRNTNDRHFLLRTDKVAQAIEERRRTGETRSIPGGISIFDSGINGIYCTRTKVEFRWSGWHIADYREGYAAGVGDAGRCQAGVPCAG